MESLQILTKCAQFTQKKKKKKNGLSCPTTMQEQQQGWMCLCFCVLLGLIIEDPCYCFHFAVESSSVWCNLLRERCKIMHDLFPFTLFLIFKSSLSDLMLFEHLRSHGNGTRCDDFRRASHLAYVSIWGNYRLIFLKISLDRSWLRLYRPSYIVFSHVCAHRSHAVKGSHFPMRYKLAQSWHALYSTLANLWTARWQI